MLVLDLKAAWEETWVGLKKKETKMNGKRKSEWGGKKRKKKGKNVGLVLFEENSVDNGKKVYLSRRSLLQEGGVEGRRF